MPTELLAAQNSIRDFQDRSRTDVCITARPSSAGLVSGCDSVEPEIPVLAAIPRHLLWPRPASTAGTTWAMIDAQRLREILDNCMVTNQPIDASALVGILIVCVFFSDTFI